MCAVLRAAASDDGALALAVRLNETADHGLLVLLALFHSVVARINACANRGYVAFGGSQKLFVGLTFCQV
jgi:hypothetical protein